MQLFGELPHARLPATRFTPYAAFGIKVEILPHFPNWVALTHRSCCTLAKFLTDCHHHLADGCQNTQISWERERDLDPVSGWTAPRAAPGLQTIWSVMGLSTLRWEVVNPWSDGLSKADMMSWDLKHPWIPCGCDRSLSRIRVCVMISMQIPLFFLSWWV
jgi:hypothetical protein